MYIAEATELIRMDDLFGASAQTWCDLGCGTGTFTLGLATLLAPYSVIHAIDKNAESLAEIPDQYRDVRIHKEVVDLNERTLSLPNLDGILMANFLHFIRHQAAFLRRLRALSGRLLIVEYDGRPPSKWVPYPLSFSALRRLLLNQGFTEVSKLGTRTSRFGGEMYSAFAECTCRVWP
jgi:ubiquinone/menaquinone biosynthesis C-methylase UbiE